ncbi:glutathione S-transferase [Cognatishimia sp. WU-CL00825]|uniref:glutathione S-transferase n=1 Tax=Cognatishimia sp. WU-CL00825 TaxID=3127658 RepID=UPI0031099F8D
MTPILYSFRRCPYAMRARLAIAVSGIQVELREILLRDKAPEFLATSPSGTVPCLKTSDQVIDESLDVMKWALAQHDPQGWLEMPSAGHDLIAQADGPFKQALDHTKYAVRHPDKNAEEERAKAHVFLHELNSQLTQAYLYKDTPTLADMAILPFVRQFANVDKARFDAEPWSNLSRWLAAFTASERFADIMRKYPMWQADDAPTLFLI